MNRILRSLGFLVICVLAIMAGPAIASAVLSGNPNPFELQSASSARTPFVESPKLTPGEEGHFIEEQKHYGNYENLSANGKQTWNIVADVLYKHLHAYELRFELSDDPTKNCAQIVHHNQGGCYQQGGQFDKMIFVSPDIDELNAEFIAYHEYSHYLQDREGDKLRFSSNKECDADLRALQLLGSWVPGFQYQCLQAGFTMDQLTLENLPNLEVQLKETAHSRNR